MVESRSVSSSPASTDLLHALANDGWEWFQRYTHPQTGLTLDGGANSDAAEESVQASIASSGFYLSLLPAAAARGLVSDRDARDRALRTLRFVSQSVDHVRGVLLHFVHWDSGKRFERSEFAVLDTAIFLNGAIAAGKAFGGEHEKIADALVDRVEWDKLLIRKGESKTPILSYGYDGENRKLLSSGANVRSSENLMAAVLAVGSTTFPVDKSCWYRMSIVRSDDAPIGDWKPSPELARILNPRHGLFTSYYGLGWADLQGLHDADGVDLWENARAAALFNREQCRRVWAPKFVTYRTEHGAWWGISAGDGPNPGGRDHGLYTVPNPVDGDPHGTVWPTAALAAYPWVPTELTADLQNWRSSDCWEKARGKYGIAPFSIDEKWVGERLLGIDLGSLMINTWNMESKAISRLWGSHPVPVRGLRQLEFSR